MGRKVNNNSLRSQDRLTARILRAELPERGVELTQYEVAAACGCSRQRIQQIERRALKKLRKNATILREFIDCANEVGIDRYSDGVWRQVS